MRIILKIAKNELRYLFYSPIAWFVIIVFLVQCAILYTKPIYDIANWQDILLKNSPGYKGESSLTLKIFILKGLFQNVIGNLYLFIPILTMGLIGRETTNGSSKLLYSSPVSLRQVVLGKYLGIMLYNMLLVFVLVIFIIIGVFNIRHIDYGMLLSAILGFYLLVCAYSAIGLFMSALSTYQIVSALSTFVIIFFLSNIGSLWQRYDVVRDLTWFLSLQNRTWKMLAGLIVSRDVIYFIIVSAMFVAFTLIKLKAGRELKPWYIRLGRYITVIAVSLLIGYVSSRPPLTAYFDTTATKFNTIPKEMQQLIKDMGDSTLEVTLYINLLGDGLEPGLPEARNSDYLNMWEPYLRFKPGIVFKYEYYYDNDAKANDSALYKMYGNDKTLKQIAGRAADNLDFDLSFFKSPGEMHKITGLQSENTRLVMRLKYQGRTEWLRTFPDPVFWPDLNNVSAAFKRLVYPSSIPKVYFVTNELERSIFKTGDREYALHTASKTSRGALINTGYNVDTLNLAIQDIPPGAWTLVLADPKTELSPVVQNKLNDYVAKGGNMFILAKTGKQYILNPFLEQFGVELMNGQLVEPTYDETPDKIIPYVTAAFSHLGKNLSWIKEALEAKDTTLKVLMPGATGLNYTNDSVFAIDPLLMTMPNRTWLKAGDLVIDSTLPPLNPAAGDFKQRSFATAAQLTRQINQKDQRIIICSDADFASNMRLSSSFGNAYFLMQLYSWMNYNEFPVEMTRIKPKDVLLSIGATAANVQKIAFVWVLPGLVLLASIILLVRRKRK